MACPPLCQNVIGQTVRRRSHLPDRLSIAAGPDYTKRLQPVVPEAPAGPPIVKENAIKTPHVRMQPTRPSGATSAKKQAVAPRAGDSGGLSLRRIAVYAALGYLLKRLVG